MVYVEGWWSTWKKLSMTLLQLFNELRRQLELNLNGPMLPRVVSISRVRFREELLLSLGLITRFLRVISTVFFKRRQLLVFLPIVRLFMLFRAILLLMGPRM